MRRSLFPAVFVLVTIPALTSCALSDGPLGMLPGGPLRSGEWVAEPVEDWSFTRATETIELESGGRSRQTRIVVLGADAYVPANLSFPPFKTWHEEALEAPEAVIRIDDRRYRRTLQRVEDPETAREVFDRLQEKYGGGPSAEVDDAWYFRLAPPASRP